MTLAAGRPRESRLPVLVKHLVSRQTVSSAVGQVSTVAGLNKQVAGRSRSHSDFGETVGVTAPGDGVTALPSSSQPSARRINGPGTATSSANPSLPAS